MKCIIAFAVLGLLVCTAAASFYDAQSGVVELTSANFDSKVLESDSLWLVEFYAPWCGHCKRLTPEWIKAAKALKGSVNIAAVDADSDKELGSRFNVQGFPTIKVFGGDQKNPTEYDGGRQASDIIASATKELRKLVNKRLGVEDNGNDGDSKPPSSSFYDGTDVVELNDEMFEKEVLGGKDAWLIEFYAPWCGHCKNLVPDWKKAAAELSGTMKIGAIDATAHKKFSSKYDVQGFPTIKFFAPGGETTEDYDGGRSAEAIVTYCNQKAEIYPSAPPQVSQIADNAALTTLCEGKMLCVIFVVPHVIDTGADGRNKMIEMFVELARKLRSKRVSAGWIVGGDHINFEEASGVFSNYPTFIALNTKSKRVATHRGAFNEDAILKSVKKILDGKGGLSQLQKIPSLSSDVPLWDGKDYVEPEDD